jgi:predicted lipase
MKGVTFPFQLIVPKGFKMVAIKLNFRCMYRPSMVTAYIRGIIRVALQLSLLLHEITRSKWTRNLLFFDEINTTNDEMVLIMLDEHASPRFIHSKVP